MKNPKDKAEELFLKFRQIPPCSHYTGVGDGEAKQCALVAVDEIIKVLYDANDTDEEYGYWTDVKQELEEL